MNDEERRYKILKKESYKKQIKEEEKKTITNIVLFGFQAACAVLLLYDANDPSIAVETITDLVVRCYVALTGSCALGTSIYFFANAIDAIGEKTQLQYKIKDIIEDEDELMQYTSIKEESKGVKK